MALALICIGITLLLCWSAFFSGSETALMASSRPKLHEYEKQGNRAAKRVLEIVKNPERLLSTILLGNNLVNIGTTALLTGVAIKLVGDSGMVWATLITTVLVLIFAEVIPKTLASRRPEKFAMMVSLPMAALIRLLHPLTLLVKYITRGFMFMVGIRGEGNAFGADDVRGAIGMGLLHGVLRQNEHRMLDSILDLNDLTVLDVMTHRSAIDSLDIATPMEDVFAHFAESTHSRIPIWENTPDNIIGHIHAKDFYKAYHTAKAQNGTLNLRDMLTQPYFVPETASVYEQLREFRRIKRHMAIVVDEYGDIQGLVTLEDLLEEIVGEIEDEHDITEDDVFIQKDGTIVLSGHYPIRDANRRFGWHLPEDEDSVTIAGLLTETAEKIPAVGEDVRVNGLMFRVVSKKHHRVLKVRVKAAEGAAVESAS